MKEFTVVVLFHKICSSPVPLLTNLRVWKQTKTEENFKENKTKVWTCITAQH